MLKIGLILSLIFSNVYRFPAMKASSTWTDITNSNLPMSHFLMENAWVGLPFFWLHSLIKYLDGSLNHKRNASTFLYIYFPIKIQYSPINSFVMIPRSTILSGHSVNISTIILGWRNSYSTSYSWETHIYSLWYKVSPIRIRVDATVATGENDSV